MTTLTSSRSYQLDNFEGPLDFLLYLVQKAEIDIYEIPIQELIDQFLKLLEQEAEKDVNGGAEFLALAAQLMLIKSRTLLPKHQQEEEEGESELDPRFEVIHALMEYCKFRDAGKELSQLEAKQTGCHFRGVNEEMKVSTLPGGVQHLSLEDLSEILSEVMERAAARHGDDIEEEEYRVIDKIRELRRQLKFEPHFPLFDIFNSERGKNELIVYFLAMLEMMKLGEMAVIREESGTIYLTPQLQENHG